MEANLNTLYALSDKESAKRSINFVIPIRHPDTVRDRKHQQLCIEQLFKSLENQSSKNWKAFIVANHSQVLPRLPESVTVIYVDIPPSSHESESTTREEMFVAIRTDKGSRIAAALPYIPDNQQMMIVDDDDFIHRDLVKFVTCQSNKKLWYVNKGYFWEDNTCRVGKIDNVHEYCGTTLIVPKVAYAMVGELERGHSFGIAELGSHRLIFERHPINNWEAIPFRATIYRVQHLNASITRFAAEHRISLKSGKLYSRFRGLARRIRRGLRGDPRGGMGIYPLTRKLKREFFG